VTLRAERVDGRIEITVLDRGVGFPSADRERLFEMFTQLDPDRSRVRGGLGVGLALVRRLVEMHGGRVEASSGGPGRGAAFRVTLPHRMPAGLAPRRIPAPPPGAGESLRILVVDDNTDSASSLATLLELSGHETRMSHDGEGAVREAEAFEPDVVLLDIGLPGMDGHEAARRIRALPGGRQILLVAVTGWGQEHDRRRSREAGFDHHVVKPLRAAALESLLSTAPRRSTERMPSRAAEDEAGSRV
jgi:CheY-like chemotaxis protein